MYAVKSDFLDDINDLSDTLRPRRKSVVERVAGRKAVGHIFGEQDLSEVHAPVVTLHRQEPRRSLTMRMIGPLLAHVRSLSYEIRMHRAAREMSGLDDRMLRDIGISRSEIMGAVRRIDPRT